jgi:hypothetical protein
MARKRKQLEAIGYMRTSSATNIGPDKDIPLLPSAAAPR